MGAGCYYTNWKKEKAAWIDLPKEDYLLDFYKDDITNIIKKLGYYHLCDLEFANGLYKLNFEPTYYGDGWIIQLKPKSESYYKEFNLAVYNFDNAERKIWKILKNKGYKLKIATSGYTSTELILSK